MPLVNKTFDQLLDFTRTTSGTFVGSNGLIQTTPASANLLTWTQQFDNAAWTKTAATVTANATTAPDGTTTADKLVENTAASTHLVLRASTVAASSHVLSIYAKAAERSFVSLAFDGLNAWFNLSTGAVGTVEAGLTGSIADAGNGWYRCTVIRTVTAAGSKTAAIYTATTNGGVSYTGDGTSGIFVWGAQLEAASAATTYTRNNGGVFPPRFDYDPITKACKGLLIEESRINIQVQSEDFSTTWVATGITVSTNSTTAPDGNTTADTLTASTSPGSIVHLQAVGNGTTYTFSLFVKKLTSDTVQINFSNVAAGPIFTFSTETFSTVASWTTSFQKLDNGWYRITATRASNTVFAGMQIRIANSGEAIYAWGAQLEAGAFATSYIPTVASQVTRTADQTSIVAPNFAPWYNQSEGTIVADVSPANNGSYALAITDGTANEEIVLRYASTGTAAVVRDGGVIQANFGTGVLTGKNALAYKVNDFAVSTNGGAAATDTSGTVPTNDQIRLGAARDGTLNINGHIRSIRYYPTRLTNAQLQALTA